MVRGKRMLRRLVVVLATAATTAVASPVFEDITARITATSSVAQTVARKCGACHSTEFSLWITHPHSRFLVDPGKTPKAIAAQWGKEAAGWNRFVSKFFRKTDMALAYGILEVQTYFRRDADGHRLLPAQWNLRDKRWEPLPTPLEKIRSERGTWEFHCAGCHVTGLNITNGTFEEKNVSCSMCHGEGTDHLTSGGQRPVLRPSSLPPSARAEICGRCHSRGRDRKTGRPYPVGFLPGTSLDEVFELAKPEPGRPTDYFWQDGTERQNFMEFQGFLQSGHSRAGLSCTTCHLAHGSDYPVNLRRKSVDLCRSCHANAERKAGVHRAHPKGEASCVDCHMAVANPAPNEYHAHTHTFRFLEPSNSLASPMPNSCTGQCHQGRDARWAAKVVKKWRNP